MPQWSNYTTQGNICGYQCPYEGGEKYNKTLYSSDQHVTPMQCPYYNQHNSHSYTTPHSQTTNHSSTPIEDYEVLQSAPCPKYGAFPVPDAPPPPCQTRFAQTSNSKFFAPYGYTLGYKSNDSIQKNHT